MALPGRCKLIRGGRHGPSRSGKAQRRGWRNACCPAQRPGMAGDGRCAGLLTAPAARTARPAPPGPACRSWAGPRRLTARPRCTAGRASTASSQRFTCGKSSMFWPCRSQSFAQGSDGHVGDGILARHEFPVGQALVQHPVEPVGLVGVAVDGVGHLFRRVDAEMVRLAEHGAEAAHLPEQPLIDLDPRGARRRDRTARSCGRDIAGSRRIRTPRSAARPARRDRRWPASCCWARSPGTRA
jgi:hypothetical protein